MNVETGLVVALGVAAAAGFIRGFLGVGSGMLMAPVFAIVFGPVDAVVIIVLMDLAVTAQLIPSVRRLIDWSLVVSMGLAAAAGMPLGSWILTTVDPGIMARVIALVVLVFVLLLMTEWRYRGPRRLPATLGVGVTSGVLAAATSMGNPPVILYLFAGTDSAATHRANFTGYFALTLSILVLLMAARGMVTWPILTRAGLLLPLFAAGVWGGAHFFARSSDRLYRRVALWLLLGVSIFGLLR